MQKKTKLIPEDYVGLAVIFGIAALGVYQIGKRGYVLTVGGVRAYRSNKKLWNEK